MMVLALVVLVAPRAHAVAPLCDPSAASMPAPVPAPPNATGDLVAPKDCDESGFSAAAAPRPTHDAPAPDWRTPPPDRALPNGIHWENPESSAEACPPKVPELHRPGYPPPVYRPPC